MLMAVLEIRAAETRDFSHEIQPPVNKA